MKIWKFTLLLFILTLTSCGAGKTKPSKIQPQKGVEREYPSLPEFYDIEEDVIEGLEEETLSIINNALQYLGTTYKYGGTTLQGMDCSGLVYTCFLENNIPLPRSSRDMALLGEQLDLPQVKLGDLLFFKTDRRKKDINHVGLVVQLEDDKILFIHSSTSRGVIISALESYWKEHFVMARRIL